MMMLQTPPSLTKWVVDPGASNHTTLDHGNISLFRSPHPTIPSSIVDGNRSILPVTSVRDTVLPGSFYLNNVLVIPDIIKNLLSIHQFTTDNWCSMEFDPFDISVKDLATRNMITRCNSFGHCTLFIFLPRVLLRHPHTMPYCCCRLHIFLASSSRSSWPGRSVKALH
jgi:hypothetical protein